MMGYLRLLRLQDNALSAIKEQDELLAILVNTPGVLSAKIDGAHPKGGYRVNCDIAMEHFEDALANIEANGWMSTI
ncbi:hypothetical protein [Herbaspirillum rubrisubalbicans]|uniref:hypothetical protein n=1 Tax=Herbaspirillum rubrisubalbicans TaxID=80842 RepID=UPI0012FDAE76|nr:hypothetical protein [Herbaspirillum rubrisubalbicans]